MRGCVNAAKSPPQPKMLSRPLDVSWPMGGMETVESILNVVLPVWDDATLTLRPGRQMLLFGKQRLVSPLDWSNTMRAWDGVSSTLDVPCTPFIAISM